MKTEGYILIAENTKTEKSKEYHRSYNDDIPVSFIKSFHPWLLANQRSIIIVFILVSTTIFLFIGKPVKTLVFVGALNGMILPVSLGVMLLAAYNKAIVKTYKHPIWLTALGFLVVVFMAFLGGQTIVQLLQN